MKFRLPIAIMDRNAPPTTAALQSDGKGVKGRIAFFDGYRGVAILLVACFHAYVRWPGLVPYGHAYEEIVLFKYGAMGVRLFFIISGFVILMTLERCKSFGEFIYLRWLRLFPGMLVCSLLIFSTTSFFPERPGGIATFTSVLPGLLFIPPEWLENMIQISILPLEGSFWSLYIEFKFYLFAAIVYFWKGERWLLGALAIAFLISAVGMWIERHYRGLSIEMFNYYTSQFGFDYFGWFAAGTAFFVYSKSFEVKFLFLAVLLALISPMEFVWTRQWDAWLASAAMSLFVALSIINRRLQKILSARILVFLGFISYPLYLLHENMMIAIIVKLGKMGFVPDFWMPVLALVALCALAYLVAKFLEPWTKRSIAFALGILTMHFNKAVVSRGLRS